MTPVLINPFVPKLKLDLPTGLVSFPDYNWPIMSMVLHVLGLVSCSDYFPAGAKKGSGNETILGPLWLSV